MEDSNTNGEENLNEEKVIIRIEINEIDAVDILNQFGMPFPPTSDIDEIHLLIKKQ